MGIHEVKVALRAGIEAIEQGRSTFEQAAADASGAIGRAHQLLHDSQDGEVQKVRKSLTEAEGEVNATVARFLAARGDATSYLADLG